MLRGLRGSGEFGGPSEISGFPEILATSKFHETRTDVIRRPMHVHAKRPHLSPCPLITFSSELRVLFV
eukprot:1843205-Pyramimonas_sp.AAC.1